MFFVWLGEKATNWSCMFCSNGLAFNFAKREQSMDIAFGFLTAHLRAHFTNMDCSLSPFGTLTPKTTSVGLGNSLASSKTPTINILDAFL